MKHFTLVTISLLLLSFNAAAQIGNLYGEARLGYNADIAKEGFNGSFVVDELNLVMNGNITPSLSFLWRQRFTKPLYDPKFLLNATDILELDWTISPHWGIEFGKIPIIVGGYEFDRAPIDLYYWDIFAGNLEDVYAPGVNFCYTPVAGQTLKLEVSQSLLGFGRHDLFHAALLWYGHVAPWWSTIWSVNWMDDPTRTGLGIVGLGNRFEAGRLAVELDLNYRTALKGGFSTDFGVIGQVEYSFPVVKIFAKGGYTYNKNNAIDVVSVGCRFIYAGAGVEVFPLKNKDLRLHAVGWWDSDFKCATVSLGVTYRLRVIKKSSSINS